MKNGTQSAVSLAAILAAVVCASPVFATNVVVHEGKVVQSNGDADFIQARLQDTVTQARLSEIASRKASKKNVRQFAQQMLGRNLSATTTLDNIAAKEMIEPSWLDEKHASTVKQISNLPKDMFNAAYLNSLVRSQVAEIRELENLPSDIAPELRVWADSRLSTIRRDVVDATYLNPNGGHPLQHAEVAVKADSTL